MIGIIDYGMGNLLSVFNAVEAAGGDAFICKKPSDVLEMERLILPGVGAFKDMMANLQGQGYVEALVEAVIRMKKPILGICLGMHALARKSFEGGETNGLGWLDAEVILLKPTNVNDRVPHMGWNDIRFRENSPLFTGLPPRPDFYFVHSYWMRCEDKSDVAAVFDYGQEVTAAVRKNNIVGTQFHPEKSQDYGLRVVENFIYWQP